MSNGRQTWFAYHIGPSYRASFSSHTLGEVWVIPMEPRPLTVVTAHLPGSRDPYEEDNVPAPWSGRRPTIEEQRACFEATGPLLMAPERTPSPLRVAGASSQLPPALGRRCKHLQVSLCDKSPMQGRLDINATRLFISRDLVYGNPSI